MKTEIVSICIASLSAGMLCALCGMRGRDLIIAGLAISIIGASLLLNYFKQNKDER